MSYNFSKNELYNSNIHELRRVGKLVGVKAPCALNKETLVDEIFEIISGQKQPEVRKDNRGRPSKNGNYFSVANKLNSMMVGVGQVASTEDLTYQTSSQIGFKPKKGVYMSNSSGEEGYIKKYPYVDSPLDARIGPSFVRDYALRDFDIVEYALVNENMAKPEVGLVVSVNERAITNGEILYNRLDKSVVNSTVMVKVNGENLAIRKGGRNLVFCPVTKEDTTIGDAICLALSNNAKNQVVKFNVNKEMISAVKANNVSVFSSLMIDNIKKTQLECERAFLEAKIGVTTGKNIFIIVDDIISLYKALKETNGEAAMVDLKRELFISGGYETGGTITVICLAQPKSEIDEELFNKIINFNI